MFLPSNFKHFKYLIPQWKWIGDDLNAIYLTFDDGPHPEVTPNILDILKQYSISATFFCTGKNAQDFPDIIARIQSEGHCIGNHSFSHENGWQTTSLHYNHSIEKTDSIIHSKLFRPPYGKVNLKSLEYLKKNKYSIIMWTWMSYDYMKSMSVERILKRATKVKGGDIVVFHDSEKSKNKICDILSGFIPMKQDEGLQFKKLVI